MTNPADITIEAPATNPDAGENWAEAATAAWIAEAARHDLAANESDDWDDDQVDLGTFAGAVDIDGDIWHLTIDDGEVVATEAPDRWSTLGDNPPAIGDKILVTGVRDENLTSVPGGRVAIYRGTYDGWHILEATMSTRRVFEGDDIEWTGR